MKNIIYLDYAATTPVSSEVVDAILPYFNQDFGNAASAGHPFGWSAKDAIEKCRSSVAQLIGAKKSEIFFTSGATEAINWVHKSFVEWKGVGESLIVTQPTEHSALLQTCYHLIDKYTAKIAFLAVDSNGIADLNQLEKILKVESHKLVSVMTTNNETGVQQDAIKVGEICSQKDTYYFCDATQSIGKEEVNVEKLKCHLLAFSAHKIGGPKGCGVLYIKNELQDAGFGAFLHGGEQEFGLRAGTQNVPAIVGLGKAIELMDVKNSNRIELLKNRLEQSLKQEFKAHIIGEEVNRAPHICCALFNGINSEDFLMKINHRLAISNGSACNSSNVYPSHVLTAMGFDEDQAFSTLRFSIGNETTEDEIDQAISILKEAFAN